MHTAVLWHIPPREYARPAIGRPARQSGHTASPSAGPAGAHTPIWTPLCRMSATSPSDARNHNARHQHLGMMSSNDVSTTTRRARTPGASGTGKVAEYPLQIFHAQPLTKPFPRRFGMRGPDIPGNCSASRRVKPEASSAPARAALLPFGAGRAALLRQAHHVCRRSPCCALRATKPPFPRNPACGTARRGLFRNIPPAPAGGRAVPGQIPKSSFGWPRPSRATCGQTAALGVKGSVQQHVKRLPLRHHLLICQSLIYQPSMI